MVLSDAALGNKTVQANPSSLADQVLLSWCVLKLIYFCVSEATSIC